MGETGKDSCPESCDWKFSRIFDVLAIIVVFHFWLSFAIAESRSFASKVVETVSKTRYPILPHISCYSKPAKRTSIVGRNPEGRTNTTCENLIYLRDLYHSIRRRRSWRLHSKTPMNSLSQRRKSLAESPRSPPKGSMATTS